WVATPLTVPRKDLHVEWLACPAGPALMVDVHSSTLGLFTKGCVSDLV
ncbi:hypothetical protein A2U01_0086268, partial [Trifolium medium]|nr:hypothetical protein [Trifolium medium]